MSGHVFVTCADLKNLACDAILVPTDEDLGLTQPWRGWATPPPDPGPLWRSSGLRAVLGGAPAGDSRDVWFVNVGADYGEDTEWFIDGARQFVEQAVARLHEFARRSPRAKLLLALPAIGTGRGGAAREKGDVLSKLLPRLDSLADRHDVDIALVARRRDVYSAAQAIRRRHDQSERWTAELGPNLVREAESLGVLGEGGELVLFIGAGVSMGAGLPSWNQLLERLAEKAGIDVGERERLQKVDALDRARLIEGRLGGAKLGEQVKTLLSGSRYALAHAMLASLPVLETATTNYDGLFESASEDAGFACAVLPYAPAAAKKRWLLKLHGCVRHPEDIVLTRDDYLRYPQRRAALAGIMQALLVTRHMLFVGFGLKDDTFHRIAYEVRTALAGSQRPAGRALGTALLLEADPLLAELWERDLHVLTFSRPNSSPEDSARRVELFLDLLGMHASTGHEYLLDDDYEDALTREELQLKSALQDMASHVSEHAWSCPAGRRLKRFLESMGGRVGP